MQMKEYISLVKTEKKKKHNRKTVWLNNIINELQGSEEGRNTPGVTKNIQESSKSISAEII